MKRLRTLVVVAVAVWLAAGVAQATGEPEQAISPARACSEFCDQLFGADVEKCDRCKDGCSEAERCVTRCREKFTADREKLDRCRYLCARAR